MVSPLLRTWTIREDPPLGTGNAPYLRQDKDLAVPSRTMQVVNSLLSHLLDRTKLVLLPIRAGIELIQTPCRMKDGTGELLGILVAQSPYTVQLTT